MSQRFENLQRNGACALITAVTVLICGCTQAPAPQRNNPGTDSLVLHINSPLPYAHLDLFIFEDTLSRAAEFGTLCRMDPLFALPALEEYCEPV